MARASVYDVSNFDESKEQPLIIQQARPSHWPPNHRSGLEGPVAPVTPLRKEEGEEPSAGTSSSTSENKLAKSGDKPQATGKSRQSPAPTAGSHSSADQPDLPKRSSSAASTAGSTHGTGASHPSQPGSSPAGEDHPSPKATRK